MANAPATASPPGAAARAGGLALTHHLGVGGLQVLAGDEPPVAPGPSSSFLPSLSSCQSERPAASCRAVTSGNRSRAGPAVIRHAATAITAIPITITER